MPPTPDPTPAHHRPPGWFTRRVLNRVVAWSTRRGLSLWGSRVLEVRGRRSGQWRATPVNLLEHGGRAHLVSPRGRTEWVRNLEAAGEGRLRLGRRTWRFRAVEIPPAERVEVLRAYLRRWSWEVGAFFEGVGADASDAELLAVADRHPVFVLDVDDEPQVAASRPR